ncbi:ribosome silencing factor [Pseudooceanicola onchidii]|uniref:ribosome silencing factor n=1 Tax=Pseudooceanicola onchidii TaxID=2562279 RepID=UPI0010AA3D4E|nr:ribosome silencing factor [Pseudooceanicola onchidii]
MSSAGTQAARHKEDNVLSLQLAAADTAPKGAAMTAHDQSISESLLELILTSLDDDKAEDIVQIDLRGRSSMGDFMVVCSGRSSRQVAAIAEKLVDRIKQTYGFTAKIEGKETGDWVLIDTGDVVVHVFRPEVREFYQLEKMWMPSKSDATHA